MTRNEQEPQVGALLREDVEWLTRVLTKAMADASRRTQRASFRCESASRRILAALEDRDRLAARVRALEEALAPFAAAAPHVAHVRQLTPTIALWRTSSINGPEIAITVADVLRAGALCPCGEHAGGWCADYLPMANAAPADDGSLEQRTADEQRVQALEEFRSAFEAWAEAEGAATAAETAWHSVKDGVCERTALEARDIFRAANADEKAAVERLRRARATVLALASSGGGACGGVAGAAECAERVA